MDFKPKLNTITDPFSGDTFHLNEFNLWLHSKMPSKITTFSMNFLPSEFNVGILLPILKASSLGPKSYTTLIDAWILIKSNPVIHKAIIDYITLTSSAWMRSALSNIDFVLDKYNLAPSVFNKFNVLGRLSFKEEAAGKLRVFAMVDVITQSLLKPLHDKLFDLFRKLPNDGTHDQEAAFDYAVRLSDKYGSCYGFDLSSATDRLPISSQVAILNSLTNSNLGDLWRTILVDRDYEITENSYSLPVGPVRYKVGQPMGALSSWAMLALTHHMMVQYCADKLGLCKFTQWYSDYVVLGDDIVIFDSKVAQEYLILCQQLGVEINLKKSVVAPKRKLVEFAKRTSLNGVDVSALSFKDFISNNNFFGRLAITTRLIRRKYGKDFKKIFIYGNRGNLKKFFDIKYAVIGYLTQLAFSRDSRFSPSNLLSLLTNKDYPLSYFGRKIDFIKTPEKLLRLLWALLSPNNFNLDKHITYTDRKWSAIKENAYKLVLLDDIMQKWLKIQAFNAAKEAFIAREQAVNTLEEREFYKTLIGSGKSLELTKPIISRSYYKDFIKVHGKGTSFLNRLFSLFFDPKVWLSKEVSYKGLWQGWEVDLSRSPILPWQFSLQPLVPLWFDETGSKPPYSKKKDLTSFVKSETFAKLELSFLLKTRDELINHCMLMQYYKLIPERKEKVIDNPLKAIDFIKLSQEPQNKRYWALKPDFMFMEGRVVDTVFTGIDEKPGFKPKFNFTIRKS